MLTAEYLAGFFDGEGCISGSTCNGNSNLSITITQRKSEILYMIDKRFPTKRGVFPKGGTKRPCFRLAWGLNEAKPLLEYIKDYVIIKKSQVELALKFIGCSPGIGGDCDWDSSITRSSAIREIHKLNDAMPRRRLQ